MFGVVDSQFSVLKFKIVDIDSAQKRAIGFIVFNHGFVQVFHEQNLLNVSKTTEKVE